MKRYAIIKNALSRRGLEAYLPDNYKVIHEYESTDNSRVPLCFVIEGEDVSGWTLDSYVKPRLMSGVISCAEVSSSHPLVREILASRAGASATCTCGIEEAPERRAHYGAELHSPYCDVGRAERAAKEVSSSRETRSAP